MAHCLEALEAAERAWLEGRDQEAEALLMAARHGAMVEGNSAMVARAEVAMARFALAIDEDERAQTHLETAMGHLPAGDAEWNARAWLARGMLQRRLGRPMQVEMALPDVDALAVREATRGIAAQVSIEFAAWARERGDLLAAERHADRALRLTGDDSRERGWGLLERGELQVATGVWDGARRSFREAIEVFRRAGLTREEGRAVARYALGVAPHAAPGTDDAPASWLGRAQILLGTCATWRDVASTRGGFRAHGRRMQDRAVGGSVAARIDALDEATARMHAVIASAVDRADRALGQAQCDAPASETALLGSLHQARAAILQVLDEGTVRGKQIEQLAKDVVDVVQTAMVERDRMRSLLDILAQVDSVTDAEVLVSTSARVGAQLLEADQVILVKRDDAGELQAVGRFSRLGGAAHDSDWRAAIDASLRLPSATPQFESRATRADDRPRGPVLVAAMRAAGIVGALYADKLSRSGRFNEQDHQLAQLFADYFALAYTRLAAVEAKRRAFEQLSTTLDTIRDGIVALDALGVVTNINAAAARMLRLDPAGVTGRPLALEPSVGALWDMLAGARRVDGAMVRLNHGSFIVTARPILSDGDEAGVVATLVELDRAQRIAQRVTAARPRYVFTDIVGQSSGIDRAIHLARRAASVEASVLITGESGTGKEVFAQAIHTGGSRAAEPFVGVNCAAVPRELLEAELFGYERGAFTGAKTEGNLGKFELAGEGTLLLDEIGDMPLDMQPKLLRVLQERVVVRLGGSAERAVRARVIATTHRDLDALVEAGRFRHDLLYRLRVLHVHLMPLSMREGDVLLLAQEFLRRHGQQQRKEVKSMSPSVRAALLEYSWPGNVRELANVIEREVSLLPEDALVLEQLQTPFKKAYREDAPLSQRRRQPDDDTILPMAEVERATYLRALELCAGRVQNAANALGVSKVTFYAKLRTWGMHPRDRNREG